MNFERLEVKSAYKPPNSSFYLHRIHVGGEPVILNFSGQARLICGRYNDKRLCVKVTEQVTEVLATIHRKLVELMDDGIKPLHRVLENGSRYVYIKITDQSELKDSDGNTLSVDDLRDRQMYRCDVQMAITQVVEIRAGDFAVTMRLIKATFGEPVMHEVRVAENAQIPLGHFRRPVREAFPLQEASIRRFLHRRGLGNDPEPAEHAEQKNDAVPPHFAAMFSKLPEEDRSCPICLDLMTDGIAMTPCFHFFHSKCLTESRKRKNECPNCRQNL